MPLAATIPLASSAAPPISPHSLLVLLLQMAVLLATAVLLGRLANRFRLPPVVGELLAGVLIGPSLLAHVAPGLAGWLLPPRAAQANLLDAVSQLGVLLLVAVTGMQLDLKVLRRRARAAVPVSLTGVVIPLGLGIGLGFLLPATMVGGGTDRRVFALYVGVAMGVSAIPVIAKTLGDLGLLHRDLGQLTLTSATVDDAVGWVLLSIVSAAATAGITAAHITWSLAATLLVVPAGALVAAPLVRWVMDLAGRSGQPGTAGAVAVIVVLLGGIATQALGLEAVLGAFVAGILVGTGRDRPRMLAPVRTFVLGVMAPLFLATVGLRMDLSALARPSVAAGAALVTVVAIAGKFAGVYLGARLSRLGHWEGLALGAGMNARGAVEVVVASVGLQVGVLNTASYTTVVVTAIITSLMAAPLVRWAMGRVPVTDAEREREVAALAWSGTVPGAAVGSATAPDAAPHPAPAAAVAEPS